jgi:hypothetical protein
LLSAGVQGCTWLPDRNCFVLAGCILALWLGSFLESIIIAHLLKLEISQYNALNISLSR